MISFGIDPGSRRCGWGAVEVDGSRLTSRGHGVIRLPEASELSARLAILFEQLGEVVEEVAPDRIFLESVFHQKNAQSALILGQARGVALLVAARSGRPVGEVSPAEVKKAVTGSGRATKDQVQEMVRVLLGLPERAPSDAADALSVAIAGASAAKWNDLRDALGGAPPKRGGRKKGWRR